MKNKLAQYKKIYWDIKLSDQEVDKSWRQLQWKIGAVQYFYFKPVAAFLVSLLVFLTGIVGLAQAAAPGSTLYQVKVLSDKVVAKVSGKPEINTERRAQDVIEVSKSRPAMLPEASKQYKQALTETEQAVEQDKVHQKQFSNSLDKQKQWLKEAIEENPKSKDELKQVLQSAQSAKEKLNKEKVKNNTQDNKSKKNVH